MDCINPLVHLSPQSIRAADGLPTKLCDQVLPERPLLQHCALRVLDRTSCVSIDASIGELLANHFFGRAKGSLLVLAIQTYMYSVLQSLRLVYPLCMPSASFFVPFGELAPVQFMSLPTDFSLSSMASFGLGLVNSPSLLVYLYVYLRPIIEVRVYRLIRRHLPKPNLADELSIRVALENDLIDWMAPTLGRRSEEENRRSSLTLWEDIKCELAMIWNWALSWPSFKRGQAPNRAANASPREERIESLRQCIEELQNELGVARSRTHQTQPQLNARPLITAGQDSAGHAEGAQTGSIVPNRPEQATTAENMFDGDRILQIEENRVSQSPDAMSTDYLSEMVPLGSTGNIPSDDHQAHESPTTEAHREQEGPDNRRVSRSNTLFSRPSSPETSPPTSPRVRASLIHQNSDIITMQLELLGNRNLNGQGQSNLRPRNGSEALSLDESATDRRSITEFLDSLLTNEDQNLATIVNSDTIDSDGLSNLTIGVSPAAADNLPALMPPDRERIASAQGSNVDTVVDASVPGVANILPDNVEEPGDDDAQVGPPDTDAGFENQPLPGLRHPAMNNPEPQQQPVGNSQSPAHRVTILSLHPVDSLASHLASMVTTVIFLPLESLYLRSIASAYLSSRGSSALLSDVRPLGAWGGGGSLMDTLAYVGKMSLLLDMQAAVNATIWGVLSGAAIRVGKRFCGWGSL